MNIEDIETLIADHLDLIVIDARGLLEARERAAKFLVAQAILARFLKDFENEKAKVVTMREASYSQCVRYAQGKNITEKKIEVDANPEYTFTREAVEKLDSIRDYIKTHMKIFDNAHLMFRQYSRE